MYARYTYNTGSAANTIQADIVKLLTGETNLNNLAACNVPQSEVTASVRAAGWTIFDNWTAGKTVLRAPISDDPTKYKYLYIDSVTTANFIRLTAYTSWDAGTHTGVNPSYNSSTNQSCINITTSAAGTIWISSSVNHAIFYFDNGTLAGPVGITERTRNSGWDTVQNGFPNFGTFYLANFLNTTSYFCAPLEYNPTTGTTSASGSTNGLSFGTILGLSGSTSFFPPSGVATKDASLNTGYDIMTLEVTKNTTYHLGGSISEKADIWVGPYNVGNNGDNLIVGTDIYVQLGQSSGRLLFRYG